MHFLAGLLIAISAGFFFGPEWGPAAAALAGLAKEIYDYFDYGEADILDAVATLAGGFAGFAVWELISWIS